MMHILVVEDEQRLARLLQRVLTEERHTVDTAFDGDEGLSLGLSDSYDLIVLDLMLPGTDGIEICRELRAAKIATPVLMLTARGAVEDKVAGLNVGADDYRALRPCCAAATGSRITAPPSRQAT